MSHAHRGLESLGWCKAPTSSYLRATRPTAEQARLAVHRTATCCRLGFSISIRQSTAPGSSAPLRVPIIRAHSNAYAAGCPLYARKPAASASKVTRQRGLVRRSSCMASHSCSGTFTSGSTRAKP